MPRYAHKYKQPRTRIQSFIKQFRPHAICVIVSWFVPLQKAKQNERTRFCVIGVQYLRSRMYNIAVLDTGYITHCCMKKNHYYIFNFHWMSDEIISSTRYHQIFIICKWLFPRTVTRSSMRASKNIFKHQRKWIILKMHIWLGRVVKNVSVFLPSAFACLESINKDYVV